MDYPRLPRKTIHCPGTAQAWLLALLRKSISGRIGTYNSPRPSIHRNRRIGGKHNGHLPTDSPNTKEFTVYTTKDGELYEYTPEFETNVQIATEIDEFLDCIKSGEKLANHIDTNIITAKMMQAIYDSAEAHREIALD